MYAQVTPSGSQLAPGLGIVEGTYPVGAARRASVRVAVELPLRLDIAESGIEAVAVSRDLGLGGMSIVCDLGLDYGDRLEIVLDVQRGFPRAQASLRLPATVRWRDGRAIGVQFGLLGPRETSALIQIVRRAAGRY